MQSFGDNAGHPRLHVSWTKTSMKNLGRGGLKSQCTSEWISRWIHLSLFCSETSSTRHWEYVAESRWQAEQGAHSVAFGTIRYRTQNSVSIHVSRVVSILLYCAWNIYLDANRLQAFRRMKLMPYWGRYQGLRMSKPAWKDDVIQSFCIRLKPGVPVPAYDVSSLSWTWCSKWKTVGAVVETSKWSPLQNMARLHPAWCTTLDQLN